MSDLTAVHFYRDGLRPVRGVVVVPDDSALMVAAAAAGNGFRTELLEPTEEQVKEYEARMELA